MICSNYWILLLTEFPILRGNGTATFIWLLWPSSWVLGVRSLTLYPLPFCKWVFALVRGFESTAMTKHHPARTREVQQGHKQVTLVPTPTSVAQFPSEEPLPKVKCLVKPPRLLSPKGCFLLRLPVRMSIWQGFGFWFRFFFSCEVDTYPLGIELGNSYFYADYQKVVNC